MARFSPWVLTLATRALVAGAGLGRPLNVFAGFQTHDAPDAPSVHHKRGRFKLNHKKAVAWRRRRRNR